MWRVYSRLVYVFASCNVCILCLVVYVFVSCCVYIRILLCMYSHLVVYVFASCCVRIRVLLCTYSRLVVYVFASCMYIRILLFGVGMAVRYSWRAWVRMYRTRRWCRHSAPTERWRTSPDRTSRCMCCTAAQNRRSRKYDTYTLKPDQLSYKRILNRILNGTRV